MKEETMNDIVTRDAVPVAVTGQVTPMRLLQIATEQGADIEKLSALMDLQLRWEKNQAKKAFDAAISAAKAEIPVIVKNREVDFTSQKGRTNYRYEDFAEVARTIDPILAKHGLSYRFRTSSKANELVTVTCVLAHRDGHSEENSLDAARDESGNKNSIQAIGSTITFLQRYTLKAALGLAASVDDDARSAGKPETKGMPESELTDHETAIEAAADRESINKAWKTAAEACHKYGDKEAHARLKTKTAERIKTLPTKKVAA
jgi:hypothetical protein